MSVLSALHKRRGWMPALVLLTAFAVQPGKAQEGKPGEESEADERILQLASMPIPSVAPYLELNKEQQTKFDELQKSYFAGLGSIQSQGTLNEDEKFEKSSVLTRETTKRMLAALSQEQQKKIPAMLDLFVALRALRVPIDMAGDLKLTPEQRSQIITLAHDMRQRLRALPPEDRNTAKGFAVMKDANAKLQSLLTPEQRVVLADDIRNLSLANPASINCGKRGGKSVIRKNADGGEYGVCVFPSGGECEEWALLRGQCSPETANRP